ncbi:hypothetical protein GCM10009552_28900 [Rothia nasimurium]|uniref:PD-(D/E)XK nuclease family protein n=1 Tax=Luteibacter anthropi TaxID=564369 RepID=A0A7X5UAI0_9GAMM|nr:PD-(D/E)XK nuclease family protein [Luteibacter anthropi]NII06916.1 PD-(D/E)XK nuclease family protein [Luteibacter anthropi]
MDEKVMSLEIEELMADERLVRLCELHRTGDSIFDVIRLTEMQHSAMLAWMLDPKEGHGQGDEILRDLLVAASVACQGTNALRKNSATASFFRARPPSALRVASFASAFTVKEFGAGNGRFDLFVVDPQNKFVLVIENKAGTKHQRKQLDSYATEIKSLLAANPHLRDYERAFIALDTDFDPDFDGEREAENNWVHLGYEWLETSASRAQSHLDRGNASARLVSAYCQALWQFELPRTKEIERLAAELHRDYPGAVSEIADLGVGRTEMTWLRNATIDRDLIAFGLQNKSVIQTLRNTNGMAAVRLDLIDALGIKEEYIESEARNVNICPREAKGLGNGHEWPVYIEARAVGEKQDRFNVLIVWRGRKASTPEVAEALRTALIGLHHEFAQRRDSSWRRVRVGENVTLPSLRGLVAEWEGKILSAIRSQGL